MAGGHGQRHLRIGRGAFAPAGFHGTVDDVFVYDVALTKDEVYHLRNASYTTSASGSAGYAVVFSGPSNSRTKPWLSLKMLRLICLHLTRLWCSPLNCERQSPWRWKQRVLQVLL